MKHFLLIFFVLIFQIRGAVAGTCAVNEFEVDGVCRESKFRVTTTPLEADTTFKFYMSAKGTFYIDWGDGNTQTIARANTSDSLYSHTYEDAGTYVIQFGGESDTGAAYKTSNTGMGGVLSFRKLGQFQGTPELVGGISGSLGALFPTRGETEGYQPRFYSAFYGCSNLNGSIPSDLFSGVYGAPVASMFASVFSGCTKLTGAIPDGLFAGLSGEPKESLFSLSFYGCKGLNGSIPTNLFAGLSGVPAPYMFIGTFSGCSGLSGPLTAGLFGNLYGAPADHMFSSVFLGCTGLSGSIPSGLFGNLYGNPAPSMFSQSFYNCTGLSGSIPSGLFGNLYGNPAPNMFLQTFYNCKNLTGSIPSGLFGNLSGTLVASNGYFSTTFNGCSKLSGYIPADLFSGLSYADPTSTNGIMDNIFIGTNIATLCPCGTTQYITGFEDKWGGRVACIPNAKSNEHWNNGICTTNCTAGFDTLKTETGLSFPVLSDVTSDLSFVFEYDGKTCYVPTKSGKGNLNIMLDGSKQIYHATVPDEIVPDGFTGQ